MRYGSVCAGIEAVTMGWHGLGFQPAFFSEIDPAPRAVLSHHYPHVPLHGDFTTIGADDYGPIDLLVGGTPCQSFSVAGLRGGMADDRGNLALEYIRLAYRKRARWVGWENVPGVFSSNGGEDFRCFLSGLVRWDIPLPVGGWQNSGIIAAGPADGAYGVAWRVLDAQHSGVPQRRRRVFVVGYLGDWRCAAAVLFERHSLQGHSPPRREKGQAAPTIPSRRSAGGGLGTDFDCGGSLIAAYGGNNCSGPIDVATAVQAHGGPHGRQDFGSETFIAHSLLKADSGSGGYACVAQASAVRRLTHRECERLQGFPDDFTLVPYRGKLMADGPRYKMLGNSMAVSVVRWIGERFQAVEALCPAQAEAA